MAKILIVEDDLPLAQIVSKLLQSEFHSVEVAHDGREGLSRMKNYSYDLIVLDWSLPGLDGIDLLSQYRANGGNARVLMLTGKNSVDERIQGLDVGADDYLTKPFNAKEMCARTRALLRRPELAQADVLKVGDIVMDVASVRLKRSGREIKVVRKEFALLNFLMKHSGRYFSPEALLNEVWPNDSDSTVQALTACIKRLRQKLCLNGETQVIRNVPGIGYGLIIE